MKVVIVSALLLFAANAAIGQSFTAQLVQLPLAITGQLAPSDPVFQGRNLDIYEIELTRQTRLVIDLDSSAFDPVLYVLERSTSKWHENDDEVGTASRLVLSLGAGKHWIGVSGFASNAAGAYALSATPVEDTIYFVADAAARAQLPTELQRFMNDVAADTGARTLLVPAPSSVEELRQLLRAGWLNDGLNGAFLIGDLPIASYQTPSTPGLPQPSDTYLQSLDCPFINTNTPGLVDAQSYFAILGRCRGSIWTSRIRPTLSGTAGVAQIRGYLDKNHRLRNDATYYDDSMIVQAATPREFTRNFSTVADAAYASHPLYARNQVTVIQQTGAAQQKQSFLAAMRKNVELLSLNVHGSPGFIQFQGIPLTEYENMTLAEFQQLGTGPKVMEFLSCAVGDPAYDSIASQVLFNSDTLLVEAAYTVILVSDGYYAQDFNNRQISLGRGLSFADVHTKAVPWSALYFFGDPTVRLEPRPANATAPILKINGEIPGRPFEYPVDAEIVAGTTIAHVPIEIENVGTATLTLNTDKSLFQATAQGLMRDGYAYPPGTNDFVFKMDPTESLDGSTGYRIRIEPGQKRTLHLLFNPSADYSGTANTLYSAHLSLLTNDPDVGQFLLIPRGSHVRVNEPPPLVPGIATDGSLTTSVFGGGVTAGNWSNMKDSVAASTPADMGGVALVDNRHIGSKGAFYVWIRVEGLGWFYQDASGELRALGKDYEPAADITRARFNGVSLPAKQLFTVVDDFLFQGRGLDGKDIDLVVGYSVDGSSVLYRNAEPIRFTVQ